MKDMIILAGWAFSTVAIFGIYAVATKQMTARQCIEAVAVEFGEAVGIEKAPRDELGAERTVGK